MPGIRRLTSSRGGSIQIYSIDPSPEFENFKARCLLGYQSAKSLQLVLMDLGEGLREDVLLVETDQGAELHIHGGQANAKVFENSIERYGVKLISSHGPAELLGSVRGERSIDYLLSLLQENEPNEKNWDIEGYEFLRPLKVVIVGPPNAGKSTFFNWMVGANQALVSNKEGTTRDLLSCRIAIGGCEVELIDTAGLDPSGLKGDIKGGDNIHSQSLRLSLGAIEGADLVLAFDWPDGKEVLGEKDCIEVAPKSEVRNDQQISSKISISVHTGQGLDRLISKIESWVETKRPRKISPAYIQSWD